MRVKNAGRSGTIVTLAISLIACLASPVNAQTTRPTVAAPGPDILFAIADDWSFPHAGVYGDTCVKTPTFDRVAREGALFTHSFCVAPSCTASRASILTGQFPHRLQEGANLHGTLPAKFAVYPDLLEKAGYFVGYMGKGWAPGQLGQRTRNPAGPVFPNFEAFLRAVPPGKPFCFWYGSRDPHRPYSKGQGAESGLKAADVKVPAFLLDTPETRNDILDYYFAVERYDHDTGEIMRQIEQAGRLDRTMVVMTSDNGMPFPRAKANLYDAGSHMPLAIRWPDKVRAGQVIDAFISHIDLCPTFLEAAGIDPSTLPDLCGHSFLKSIVPAASPVQPATEPAREPGTPPEIAGTQGPAIFVERERHANVRAGDLGYPSRALRTGRYLYILNLRPQTWPAGDPQLWKSVGPFGDIDPGPTKEEMLLRRSEEAMQPLFELATAKRPREELYDLEKDPAQVNNVADHTEYAAPQQAMRARLETWMKSTGDPRAAAGGDYTGFDKYPYLAGPGDGVAATRPARRGAATRPARSPE